MEAKDLRIGNKILFYKSMVHEPILGTVTSIDNYEGEYKIWIPEFSPDIMLPLSALKPIKLTEEWLLKMGFKQCSGKRAHCFYEIPISNSTLTVNGAGNEGHGTVWIFNPLGEHAYNPPSIQHVHQLQNLYFALTNTELTINL